MTVNTPFDAMFSGVIGQDYQMLKLICPFATEMSRLVGEAVGEYCRQTTEPVGVVELGGGTGITTLSILSSDDRLSVLSVDNEPTMQNQAKQNLRHWLDAGRLVFCGDDALTALRSLASESVDILASAYTLHNFERDYRKQVIGEMFRVLKPGGWFVNGDRYALDDISAHTRGTQQEVKGYFKVLTGINRIDLLEHWIIHLFNDESENHIMREATALQQLAEAGFKLIELKQRMDVNALVTAVK
ncbi:MAG: class I SAM-dependent methyltransferase [Methylococcaceae bacterium]|nr:class I SAM-dependent methyltransferase [Methylococcaceae bacterium]